MKPPSRNRRRSSRAPWWFEKMRGIVEDARDWPAAPPSSEPEPPAATTSASHRETGAPPAPPSYRWKFSRARQLRWE